MTASGERLTRRFPWFRVRPQDSEIDNPLAGCPPAQACQRRSFIFDVPAPALFSLASQAIDTMTPESIRRMGDLHLAAVYRVWMFRDDLELMVQAQGDGSLLHIRSASRFGAWDFGVNSRRIRKLVRIIDDLVRAMHPRANIDAGRRTSPL